MSWLHWSSFWIGVLCAWSLPWILLGAVLGVSRAIQEHERRRIARALMDPGASHAAVSAALAGRQARRDAAGVEELLRSLSRRV